MAAALFILVTIQIGLVIARDDAPGLAALHPVLALFAMGLAVHIGLHVCARGARASPTRGPTRARRTSGGAEKTSRG